MQWDGFEHKCVSNRESYDNTGTNKFELIINICTEPVSTSVIALSIDGYDNITHYKNVSS